MSPSELPTNLETTFPSLAVTVVQSAHSHIEIPNATMLSGRAILPVSRAAASRSAIGSRLVLPLGARTYAQAVAAVDSKPPIALFGLDGTYASALVCD